MLSGPSLLLHCSEGTGLGAAADDLLQAGGAPGVSEQGVLVLSALAGAAQELEDAVIINPYDVDAFADALMRAIDMPAAEQTRRMQAMRKIVAGRNVFNWASDILEGLESLWTKPLLYSVRGWEETAV